MAENIEISRETKPKISSAMKSFLSAAGVISNLDDCEYIFESTAKERSLTISVPTSAYKALSGKIFDVFSAAAKPFYKDGLISGFAALQGQSAVFCIIASGENTADFENAILQLIQGAKEKYKEKYFERPDTPSLET